MSTKERCLQCGEKLLPEKIEQKKENIKDPFLKFCNAHCMNEWSNQSDDLS